MQLNPSMIILKHQTKNKSAAIIQAGSLLVEYGYVTEPYINCMLEREETVSTYIGNGIAIPHGINGSQDFILHSGISIVQLDKPVNFGTEDDRKEVRLVFGIAGKDEEHLAILSKIALFCTIPENVSKLVHATTTEELIGYFETISLS